MQQHFPDGQLVEAPRRRNHSWTAHNAHRLARLPGQLLQVPEEVDVLAYPDPFVVPAYKIERAAAAELGWPLDHRSESRKLPPASKVHSHDPSLRPIVHLRAASEAVGVAHRLVYRFEERDRHIDVRIHEHAALHQWQSLAPRLRALPMPCTGS